MDINAERKEIISELNRVNDISLLKAVKYILYYGLKKEGHISEEDYNRELEEADDEISKGDYINHDDVKKQMLKW